MKVCGVNTGYARSVASMNTSGVGPHLLRAFVYVFRRESERKVRQRRHRSDNRLCCMQRTSRNSAYVRRIQLRRLSGLCLFSLTSLSLTPLKT